MSLTVIAKFEAKPGMEDKVKEGLQAMLDPSHAEPGCLTYNVYLSNDNPALLFTYENWINKDALDAHMQTPHFRALDEACKETLAKPMDIDLLTQV